MFARLEPEISSVSSLQIGIKQIPRSTQPYDYVEMMHALQKTCNNKTKILCAAQASDHGGRGWRFWPRGSESQARSSRRMSARSEPVSQGEKPTLTWWSEG
jgi:hypothetical protein